MSLNTDAHNNKKLPSRLVGRKCTSRVAVNGVDCSCLLDTGSQVTIISMTFYQDHLSKQPIKPISDLLEVEGANGQTVPYLGYVETNIKFPKNFLETEPEILTLALIVPDLRSNSDIPLLIGTNTLDPLYDLHCESLPHCQSIPYGYQQVLKTLEIRKKQAGNGKIGRVKLKGRTQDVLPANQKALFEGFVCSNHSEPEQWALLEQPTSSSLPGGVFVDCCLITLPKHGPYKVPVLLRNETNHDITLPTNCVIAELVAPDRIIPNPLPREKNDQPITVNCSVQQQNTDTESSLNFDFGTSPLPEGWKHRITQTLNTFSDVFSHSDLDFGHATKVQHHINLKDGTPFKQRSRPIHPHDFEAVKKHLRALLDAGVIKESESPFSSPIVVVRKKNGDVRLCVDYRKLNLQTIRDAYALPNLEESFSALAGSKWFSVMDLKSGYYQIEMCEADKPKTAFVCPFGFYEFNRMPQGITNAPSTFQRLMEKCMTDINLKEVLVFLDDLIVFSSTLEEHETRLIHVLERLREYGLKLSPDKCRFFQTSVHYLGHIVSREGVKTDPEKVESLKTWPRPQTLKELQSFLGFTGYYRRFVKDYSKIVKPLTSLTAGYPPRRKGCKAGPNDGKYLDPKQPFGERWSDACQQAFEGIIEKLTSAPVLGYADPKLPYFLHTDASTTGLGAALYQEQGGTTRAVAYASQGLSRSESRYPAHKLEFLALKWAITDKFHDYLYGNTFTVVTDNNPLTYLLTSAKLDAASYRWLAALSTYTFDIKYRAGRQNLDADGLSRRPHEELVDDVASQEECQRIEKFRSHHLSSVRDAEPHLLLADTVTAACQRHTALLDDAPPFGLVQSLAMSSTVIPTVFEEEDLNNGLLTIPKYSHSDLMQAQRDDSIIGKVISLLESGSNIPAGFKADSSDLHLILKEWKRLELKDDLLYRKRFSGTESIMQFVLPEALRSTVLQNLHDNMGHLGMERTVELVRSRFYWPRMASDVERKIKMCERCVRRKAPPDKAAPLVNIQTTRPLELVCMDFLSLEPDSKNTKDILVITDHFTKYAVAIPTRDQKASTVARCLWEHFLVHYGFPERLHSDQGRDFESHTIRELCFLLGIRKVRTSPYHPRGNPVERYNRTLLSMLGTLKNREKAHWRDFVKPLTHAYNCTKNDVTGFSPYELMFGRQPRLPVDIAFGLPVTNKQTLSHSHYVKTLKSHLKESYEVATKNSRQVAEKNKRRFDKVIRESTLDVGDRVLVRNLRLRSKHKLADRWEPTVYVVTKRMGDLPVYTLKPEKEDGPLRTLHRDLLLPCGFLSQAEEEEPERISKPHRPQTRQSVIQAEANDSIQEDDDDEVCYQFEPSQEIKETHFIKIYDTPILKPGKQKEELGKPGREPDKHLPEMSTGAPHLPGSPSMERPSDGEPSPESPERENESESNESNVEHGVTADEPPGCEETDHEAGDSLFNQPPSMPDNTLADGSDLPGMSSMQTESQNVAETEMRDQVDEQPVTVTQSNDSDLSQSIRRSERLRQPPKRLDYSQLGSPLVTVVRSLFQGLSEAFIDSLNNDNNWSQSQAFGMTTPIVE